MVSSMKRRVVITGLGAVTPLGNDVEQTWEAVRRGECGIGPITLFDPSEQKVKIAGEVKGLAFEELIDKKELRKMDRYTQLAMVAAHEVMRSSGLDLQAENTARCGVIVSSGIGGLGTIESEHSKGEEKGFDRVSPFFIPMVISNIAAGHIAIKYGFRGMCSCTVTACASGSNAIGDSFRLIRDGYADVMLCGGAEATITPLSMGGFTSMKALCTSNDPQRASIPFDKERSGFVMGEGAGLLMLEDYDHAVARGAKILGEVVGYAASCDAYHMTAPAPGGEGAVQCMREAIADAGLSPSDICYINAHGTSTPMNDRCETAAIHTAFGEHADQLMVSSTKSMTGHLLGASGAVEAIFCALALRDGFIPATIHYQVPDEDCDLDIVPNKGRDVQVDYALSNSLGFGGHNATLIFKRV